MTEICPPCRRAADLEADTARHDPGQIPGGHLAEICRDHALQPAGCPCAHEPVGTAVPAPPTEGETR